MTVDGEPVPGHRPALHDDGAVHQVLNAPKGVQTENEHIGRTAVLAGGVGNGGGVAGAVGGWGGRVGTVAAVGGSGRPHGLGGRAKV